MSMPFTVLWVPHVFVFVSLVVSVIPKVNAMLYCIISKWRKGEGKRVPYGFPFTGGV